eukprot:CAMPEP_0198698184 /NCGR_PEP_ID=MMETSP1468-20131203/333427_1 /TAXON_ID=1461545 /ORGANISM="Mantoniella sp, Strain CCMP1436" /LENGTH=62 /DNA_ID=CAMNT_0044455109 /DNA_START=51 /DNA_END=235 /DNA_ORIENTATION=-
MTSAHVRTATLSNDVRSRAAFVVQLGQRRLDGRQATAPREAPFAVGSHRDAHLATTAQLTHL